MCLQRYFSCAEPAVLSRARDRQAESHSTTKAVPRALGLVSAIIALCVAGYSYTLNPGFIRGLLAASAISIVVNAGNLTARICCKQAVHPGLNVGMDLIAWLALVVALGFSFTAAAFFLAASSAVWSEDDGQIHCDFVLGDTRGTWPECVDALRKVGTADMAASVFGTFSLLQHFVCFVWACVETARRNAMAKRRAAARAAEVELQQRAHGRVRHARCH